MRNLIIWHMETPVVGKPVGYRFGTLEDHSGLHLVARYRDLPGKRTGIEGWVKDREGNRHDFHAMAGPSVELYPFLGEGPPWLVKQIAHHWGLALDSIAQVEEDGYHSLPRA